MGVDIVKVTFLKKLVKILNSGGFADPVPRRTGGACKTFLPHKALK